ncbi:hypothetical protein A0J61_01141 [Choanephora cucurbitarum]|uniref:Uncharacterized protein n=1 Tax=Choanephora cucurbitarum TaxID=101091 RepID=A0A1C7NNW4_9FUNG|nr:hypothetical protein A0J61_01141 [Choanephora cucurbitarum]
MSKASEVYNYADNGLNTLSTLRQVMLQIIEAVSSASASSLTVEPDLVSLQKLRKEYEQLMAAFKSTVEWLDTNQLTEQDLQAKMPDRETKLKENAELKEESARVNDQLKRMLNQSYALQLQIEMLLNSSQDISLG